MAASSKKANKAFSGRRVRNYQRPAGRWMWHPALREGRFTRYDIPAMHIDAAVNIGLYTIYGPLFNAEFEVRANSKEIKTFVENTLYRFWHHDLMKVLQHYISYGTCVAEVLYEHDDDTGLWQYAGLDDFEMDDVQALKRGRHLSGARISPGSVLMAGPYIPVDSSALREENEADCQKPNELRGPKLFWCSHMPVCGQLFGRSSLMAAWPSWMEKCGAHGATSIRKLWAFSNSYRGCLVKYPAGGQQLNASGEMVSNQDIARELAENYCTGAALVCPSERDEKGNPLWEIIDPKLNGEIKGLMEYPESLDRSIWQGMGLLDEVIHAPDTGGSWSGRSGPLLIFLNIQDMRVREIVTAFDVGPSGYTTRNEEMGGVIRSLVLENFGAKAKYEIRPISLVPKPQGQGGQPGQPESMPGNPGASGDSLPTGPDAGAPPSSANPVGPPPGQQGMGGPPAPMGTRPIRLSGEDDGWVELPGEEIDLSATQGLLFDESKHPRGHEGNPGQFAKKGKSQPKAEPQQPQTKPKRGERASFAYSQYHTLIAQAKKARVDAFNEVKADAQASHAKVSECANKISKTFGNVVWDTDYDGPFNDLDTEISYRPDDTDSVKERYESFKSIEETANTALEHRQAIEKTKDDQLAFTPDEIKENKAALEVIISHAREARKHLKAYVQHRKEMKAIKEGSPMDVQLSMLDDAAYRIDRRTN